jgi:hypothetical protein
MDYRSFAKRVGWTFAQVFLATLLMAPVIDLNSAKGAAIVAGTTILAVVKNLATERVKEYETVESHLKDGDGLAD